MLPRHHTHTICHPAAGLLGRAGLEVSSEGGVGDHSPPHRVPSTASQRAQHPEHLPGPDTPRGTPAGHSLSLIHSTARITHTLLPPCRRGMCNVDVAVPWAQPRGVKHLHAAVLAASTVCRHWDEEAPWDLGEKTAAPGGSRSRSTILPSRGRLKAERGCDRAAAAARPRSPSPSYQAAVYHPAQIQRLQGMTLTER